MLVLDNLLPTVGGAIEDEVSSRTALGALRQVADVQEFDARVLIRMIFGVVRICAGGNNLRLHLRLEG